MSANESITNLPDAVAAMGALPVPFGPQMPDFPPPPRTELEKLHAERARLQDLLAEAIADKHRACNERDDMRERVSEPYGCTHCGITKRGHGRRWTLGVGYHAWAAPSEGQIAERMKARRTVRLAARAGELGRLRAQVEALLVERHVTNEALDDAVQALRANSGPALPWAHTMSDHDLHGFLDDLVSAALGRWRSEPEVPDRTVLADIEKVCADWRTPGRGLRSDEPEAFVPRTERSYWVAIAEALNAAHSAGMPVGIDLDGTLTDRNAWSVVWDRAAERWTVDGYEDDAAPGPDERPVNELTAVFVPVASLREPEGEFHSYLHHPYTTGHDRPETGGAQ